MKHAELDAKIGSALESYPAARLHFFVSSAASESYGTLKRIAEQRNLKFDTHIHIDSSGATVEVVLSI